MNRRLSLLLQLAAAILLLLSSPAFCGEKVPPAKPFLIVVKANKLPGSSPRYECCITVTDAATKQVLCAPKMYIAKEEGNASLTDPEGREFFFSVIVEPDGANVSYTFEAMHNSEILQEEKGTAPIQ